MCNITDIRINNFRGIKSLDIKGLGNINVFLGNNNSGKSSTLEALMVVMGSSKPVLSIEMNFSRDYSGVQKDDLALFFYDTDTKMPIEISVGFANGGNRSLKIHYYESSVRKLPISDIGNVRTDLQGLDYGLKYDYIDNGITENNSSLVFKTEKGEMTAESTEKKQTLKNAVYVAPRYNFNDFIKHFNQIVTDKEKNTVLDVLRNIEPRIQDVTVIGEKVMVDIGLQKMIPINVLGDGTRKMFTLITAMYSAKGGVLLIDEVDNGLYYNSMSTLWAALLKSSKQLGVQLFVSTHSIDSLNALNNVLEYESEDRGKEVNIYTLRHKNDGEVVAFLYDFDKFSYLLSREVEIR